MPRHNVSTTERKKLGRKERGPHIFWRGERAYGDFRAYADVGGKKSPLAEGRATWGTKDPQIAQALFAAELARLQEKRRAGAGAESRKSTQLDVLVREHLKLKRAAGQTSWSHLSDLEHRLGIALEFFGKKRDPRTIEPDDVRAWANDLGNDGKRKPGTVRHFLNAMSGLYKRAQEQLCVEPNYNPVAMWTEKPTGRWKGDEARFFEVADAALLLEAARIIGARGDREVGVEGNRVNATPGLHAIIATFLLTGGRASEVLGLDVQDVSFDRGLVRFRPNEHRGLKTQTSVRDVPLWPQLRDVLQEWMFGGEQPRTAGLLFPSTIGGMIQDLRKSLDAMGELAGMDEGEVRTRRFRHTYCSARLQTVQRIMRPGSAGEWDYLPVEHFTVQKEMGHGGEQLVKRIYGHAQRNPYRSEVVEYRVDQHAGALEGRIGALQAAWPAPRED